MQAETRNCQNCKKDFTIEPRDFSFYERIDVPPPTWCPDCRCIRRMVHRNERSLFRRKCDVTGKNIISIYRPDSQYLVCDKDYYFSDNFDPFKYGYIYDPNKKFFEQFYEFAKKVPMTSLFVRSSENCDYNHDMSGASNCYLCARTHDSDNVFYGYRVNKSSYCNDCFQAVEGCEFLYECFDCITCSNSKFLHSCEKCSDSAFLYNCTGCVDSFMCTNQRNKSFYYKNKQYTREEYKKIVDSYNLSTREGQEKALKEFEDFVKQFPEKNLSIIRSNNVTGDNIVDSKDSYNVWNVRGLQNCSHVWDSFNFTDSMDTYSGAKTELTYESTATTSGSSNCRFCVRVYKGSRDCEYSWFLLNCSDCFACISLTNKQYCIFNVQYTKEEYFKLKGEIIARMREGKEYGEFFPLYTSPFPYNDTVSQEYFPKTEAEVKNLGLLWGDFEEKSYKATMTPDVLPQDISQVEDSILSEVISCEHDGQCAHGCTKAFKIVADELSFYRRRGIPLPTKCPNCRYYRRLSYRNPTVLRATTCMCNGAELSNGVYKNTVSHSHGENACGKAIETSISEDNDSLIYCDECYKKEVY